MANRREPDMGTISPETQKISLEPIAVGRLLTSYGPESEGADCETHKVSVRYIGGSCTAYLKLYKDHRKIVAELAASQLGRALGLNIPKPFLVIVDPGMIPADQSSFDQTGTLLAFASAQAGKAPVSFNRLINSVSTGIHQLLLDWKGLNSTIAFDEWLANVDRNPGNILFNAEDKSFWLIDHGQALTGSNWPLWGLEDHKVAATNVLLNELLRDAPLDTNQKAALRDSANELMLRASQLDFDQLDPDNYFGLLVGEDEKSTISTFAYLRAFVTVELICKKIGMPGLF